MAWLYCTHIARGWHHHAPNPNGPTNSRSTPCVDGEVAYGRQLALFSQNATERW